MEPLDVADGPDLRSIRYLGSKRKLTGFIGEAIDDVGDPGNHVFDLFAGACNVGYALKRVHEVTTNDVQRYSFHLAKALVENESDRPSSLVAALELGHAFSSHRDYLAHRLKHELRREQELLSSESGRPGAITKYQAYCSRTPYVESPEGRAELSVIVRDARRFRARSKSSDPWVLFTGYFANAYFGVWQCVEIDAIRRAIDEATDPLNKWRRHVYLTALIYTLSQSVSSPGHFAQFLKPKSTNGFLRVQSERRKAIWPAFLANVALISSLVVNTPHKHRSLCADWRTALRHHSVRSEEGPGVIYADPPYTSDHYSRFYHVLETLVRYDYPQCKGIGRYREGRRTSRFSFRSTVEREFELLARTASRTGAALVVSYSSHGLVPIRRIVRVCRTHYRTVHLSSAPYNHSNQGRPDSEREPDDRARREYLVACASPN